MTVLATLPLARTSTAALLSAVTDAGKATPTRPSVPVLAGLRLHQLANGLVEVTGFDYETAITRRVPMDGELGDVLVPAAMLRTALKNLNTKQPLTLAVEGDRLVVRQDRKRVRITLMNLDDYPNLIRVPKQRNFTVAGEHLFSIATQVAPFASRNDMLPVLAGVRLEVSDSGCLSAMATDRYRLALAEYPVRMPLRTKSEVAVLVPNMPLVGTLLKTADKVAVTVHDGSITFHTDDTTITQRLLDGEFPKVRSLFPPETRTTAVVDPTALLAAVKFAATGCERNTPVHLNVGKGQVEVKGTSGEDDIADAIDAAIAGDDVTMGFNPDYLTDCLRVWGKGHAVTIGVTQPTRPATFTSPAAEGLRLLLMPVRITG